MSFSSRLVEITMQSVVKDERPAKHARCSVRKRISAGAAPLAAEAQPRSTRQLSGKASDALLLSSVPRLILPVVKAAGSPENPIWFSGVEARVFARSERLGEATRTRACSPA